MKAKDLTPNQRIEILEDVLQKLERGNIYSGLCVKIKNSAFKLFHILDEAKNIIPLFTFKNAKKVTEVRAVATEDGYWWYPFENYDFENRIKFVEWMIEQERINNLNL